MPRKSKTEAQGFPKIDGQLGGDPVPSTMDSPLPDTGDFSLSPPEEHPSEEPVPRRGRPRGSGKKKATIVVAVPEQPPDESLIQTCQGGVEAITGLMQSGLQFSDPGEKWRRCMAELSARGIQELEQRWIQENPLKFQIALQLSIWMVPNLAILGSRVVAGMLKKKDKHEQRNLAHFRPQADPQDTAGTDGDAPA